MDKLWAPWRMEYIAGIGRQEGCFLCEALKAGNDRAHLILHRGKEVFVIMNKYPYNSGHVMIVPKGHGASLLSLSGVASAEMIRVCGRTMDALTQSLGAQGFNCGLNMGRVAGAGVEDHLHLHVVPRWAGDFNFLPVLGETKCLPEYLEETFDKILPEFQKIGG